MTGARAKVALNVNGEERIVSVRGHELLVDTLRREFGLTSVRSTCGIGICGTCTVLVDGKVASSCLLLTSSLEGRSLVTSEGLLDDEGQLHPIQEAFVRHGAYQCSFCIPAMVLTVKACIDENRDATIDEVREYLAGNLCRCGTYVEILEAAADVLAKRQQG